MRNETFKKSLLTIFEMNNITAKPEWFTTLWKLLRDDFTDEEFNYSCECILKNEVLYNKPPPPNMFYKYKPKTELTECDNIAIACRAFIDNVSGYLGCSFVTTIQKTQFANNLTETEERVLKSFGGISELWTQTNREDGYRRSLDKLLKELAVSFTDNCRIDNNQNNVLEYQNKHMQGRVSELLQNVTIKGE